MKAFEAYTGFFSVLHTYWKDYGGFKDLIFSPLFHISLIITACSYRVWLLGSWTDIPLSVLPNLLGFSLGAYALIFSLAGEGLMLALAKAPDGGGKPLLNMINATFLHFITVQTVAIVFALAQKGTIVIDIVDLSVKSPTLRDRLTVWLSGTAGAFGYWLTVYAVVLLIGAGLAVYRLANMNGTAAVKQYEAKKSQSNGNIPVTDG